MVHYVCDGRSWEDGRDGGGDGEDKAEGRKVGAHDKR